jgi:hypothetical protein
MAMLEKRRTTRSRRYYGGTIIFNHQFSTMDCLIRNLSKDGAKLEFSNTVTVPGEFDIIIKQDAQSYRARMIWRRENEAGVKFINDNATVIPMPLAWARRLRDLETKNAAQIRRIEELTSAG